MAERWLTASPKSKSSSKGGLWSGVGGPAMLVSLNDEFEGAGKKPSKAIYLSRQREYESEVRAGDKEFLRCLDDIDELYRGLDSKHTKIRVNQWLEKLSEPMSNVVWKKNRNAYARLLVKQLQSGQLSEPFYKVPKSGPLPMLPQYLRYNTPPSPTYRCNLSPHRRHLASSSSSSASSSKFVSPGQRSLASPSRRGKQTYGGRSSSGKKYRRNFGSGTDDDSEQDRADWEDRIQDEGYAQGHSRVLEQRLEAAMQQIESQQQQIKLLQSELETERVLRSRESQRLRKLHLGEVRELHSRYRKELDTQRDSMEYHNIRDDVLSADLAKFGIYDTGVDARSEIDELLKATSVEEEPGSGFADQILEDDEVDDDAFLQYMDEFQAKMKRAMNISHEETLPTAFLGTSSKLSASSASSHSYSKNGKK